MSTSSAVDFVYPTLQHFSLPLASFFYSAQMLLQYLNTIGQKRYKNIRSSPVVYIFPKSNFDFSPSGYHNDRLLI